jgi:two-component system, sporulation sensor kinase D
MLYVLIVIIPSTVISFLFLDMRMKNNLKEESHRTEWVGSIHKTTWNDLISETVTSLDMLSITIETGIDTLEEIQPLLSQAQKTDPRYGGIHLLNSDGDLLTGSNKLVIGTDFSKYSYIQEVIAAKDIVISNQLETLNNGQRVIGIGFPVTNNHELSYILLAHIRVDYIQNVMKVLTPDDQLYVMNAKGDPIMGLNTQNQEIEESGEWLSIPFDMIPWSMSIKINGQDKKALFKDSAVILVLIGIFFHIFFLFVLYILLKRRAAIEKKQNEIQKLELVGTLAASTAHEIRNPLTGINGLIQLLSEKYTDPQDQFYFTVINKEINRINEIVGEFLILGKPTAQKMESIDLRDVLMELDPLIASEAAYSSITYNKAIPPSHVMILCTKDQMKQVILNVTKNAFESMKPNGSLTISLIKLENTSTITITDTGIGIPKADMDKIFNPFYTSKETGTGLGLVVCKRIIESFNGEISISSKENNGTKVTITLPLAKE